MGSISRRDASKILLAGSTGLVLGARSVFGATPATSLPGQPQSEQAGQKSSSTPPGGNRKGTMPAAKRDSAPDQPAWSDVLLADGPEPIVSYRTGWVVYEESLSKGQFVGRGWNGAG
jgi:hypothetical protein